MLFTPASLSLAYKLMIFLDLSKEYLAVVAEWLGVGLEIQWALPAQVRTLSTA